MRQTWCAFILFPERKSVMLSKLRQRLGQATDLPQTECVHLARSSNGDFLLSASQSFQIGLYFLHWEQKVRNISSPVWLNLFLSNT